MLVAEARPGNSPTAVDREGPVIGCVRVCVPARLHVGFLDLNGGLGRRFGSLGISLEAPQTRLTLRRAAAPAAEGPSAERAQRYLAMLVAHFGLDERMHVTIESAIPEHVGLGSGTQLSLAIAIACCRLHGLAVDLRVLARLLDRGARSSIGIATFEQGGVILDGGRGATDLPPPVLARMAFPDAWRVLLIFDDAHRGLHGTDESDAFCRLPVFPPEVAAHLCRVVLMVALPALAEQDLDRFGGAIAELQRAVGDYFAPAQGARFTSPQVTDVLGWLESEGIRGVGQSSWGPTGFAIVGSERDASQLLHAIAHRWPASSGLRFAVSRGRNHGGDVVIG